MKIDFQLSRATIEQVIYDFAPVRIHLTRTDEDRSFIDLEDPTLVEMVPGRGVRVVCSGRVRYALGPMAVPLRLRRAAVLLVPEVVQGSNGAPALGFGIEIEEGDLELLPGLVEGAIADRVNAVLKPAESPLRCELGALLTKSFKLPERLEPLDCFGIRVRDASVVVDDRGLSLSVTLDLRVSRTRERATDDARARAPRSA